MPKKQRAYTVHSMIEHKINMALHDATHCCNLKRTALGEKNALHYDNKTEEEEADFT